MDNLDFTQLETEKPIICIQTFKESGCNFSLERTLEALRPEYVVLYHCDVAAVRQIELFECRKKVEEPKTKVYFMIHDKTVEEQAYLTSLKREKQAFELLIQTKSVSTKSYMHINKYWPCDTAITWHWHKSFRSLFHFIASLQLYCS